MANNFLSGLTTLTTFSALLTVGNITFAQAVTIEFFNHPNFLSAAGDLTLIDFDNLTPGFNALSGNEFSAEGLTIVQRDNFPMNVTFFGDGSFLDLWPASLNSSPNGLSSSAIPAGGFNDSATDNFDFTFSHTVNSAGLWIGNTGPGITEVQFLDAMDNIIASEVIDVSHVGTVGSCPNCRIFYGITTEKNIARIRTIEEAFDADGIVYDDVQFSSNAQSVPEPTSTLSLLVLSILGAASTLKHKLNRFRSEFRSCIKNPKI